MSQKELCYFRLFGDYELCCLDFKIKYWGGETPVRKARKARIRYAKERACFDRTCWHYLMYTIGLVMSFTLKIVTSGVMTPDKDALGYNGPNSSQQTLVVFNGASSWGEPFIIVMVGTLLTMPLLGPVGILQNRVAAHFKNDEESDEGEDDAEAVEMQRMDRGLVQEAVVVGGRDDRCSCGAPYVAGTKFCDQCGADVPSKPPLKAEQRDDRCSCGAPHVAGSKFCNQCGADVPSKPPLKAEQRDDRCNCGAPHVAGTKFCDQCGADVTSPLPVLPPPALPPPALPPPALPPPALPKPTPKGEQRDDRCSCGAPHVAGTKFCDQCGATTPLAQRRAPKQQLTTVDPGTPVESQTAVL